MYPFHEFIRTLVFLQLFLVSQGHRGNGLFQRRFTLICYSDPLCLQTTICDDDLNLWIKNEHGHCIPHLPDNYTPPVFTYCPPRTHRVTVYVNKYINIGYLHDVGITAENWKGDRISFTLSKRHFSHCNCSDSHEIVTATARDRYGSTVECKFTVIVIDMHPPTFSYCPKDQTVPSIERVMWKKPIVTDNVGVKELIQPEYLNNTRLSPGLYIIAYKATDWDGNIANCIFRITVTKADVKHQLESTTVDSTLAISGTIVGALFIILIVISTAMFRLCRKRHQLRNRTNRQQSRIGMISSQTQLTDDNRVFTIYNNDPPPYEVIAKDRLPDYAPRDNPPSYEEIEQQNDQGEDNLAFTLSESRENSSSEEDITTSESNPSGTGTDRHGAISMDSQNSLRTNPQSIHTEV